MDVQGDVAWLSGKTEGPSEVSRLTFKMRRLGVFFKPVLEPVQNWPENWMATCLVLPEELLGRKKEAKGVDES